MKVFINYRREDSEAYARLLRDRLADVYGAESVFLDVVDLTPGLSWLEQIKASSTSCGAFLALIGPRWMSTMTDRAQRRFDDAPHDVVRQEIEFALSRGSRVEVIPLLVGGAQMPSGDGLVRSIRPLTSLQAIELRHTHFDADLEHLIETLNRVEERVGSDTGGSAGPEPADENSPAAPRAAGLASTGDREHATSAISHPPRAPAAEPATSPRGTAPVPDHGHFATVLRYLLDDDGLVPVLGPDVNFAQSGQTASNGSETFPNAQELAIGLSQRFGVEPVTDDLPKVAQQVFLTCGSPDLYRGLKRLLSRDAEPSVVHRFLAQFPRRLEELGLPKRRQLIVTTNYDDALERAFDDANEPYDVAVYMASGIDRGRFVHFPVDADPEVITLPNRYGKLPIDEYGEVQRSLIVKVHGAVDGSSGGYRWKDNYVITEDQYIEYLSHSPVERLVPIQILDKLTSAHCLFLGYSMHDWNLRVFLKRIWGGAPIPAKSWAIERDPESMESDFWRHSGVDLLAAPLADYVQQLAEQMRLESGTAD